MRCCSSKELLCGGIQSVVRAWERSGLASRGRNEGGEWLPRARPAQSPTQRPQKLPRRLDIARAPIHRVSKAELSPNNIVAAAREQLAREPSRPPNASSPSSSIFEDLPYNRCPIYQASAIVRAADCCHCSGPASEHPLALHTIAKMVGKKSGRALLREEGK